MRSTKKVLLTVIGTAGLAGCGNTSKSHGGGGAARQDPNTASMSALTGSWANACSNAAQGQMPNAQASAQGTFVRETVTFDQNARNLTRSIELFSDAACTQPLATEVVRGTIAVTQSPNGNGAGGANGDSGQNRGMPTGGGSNGPDVGGPTGGGTNGPEVGGPTGGGTNGPEAGGTSGGGANGGGANGQGAMQLAGQLILTVSGIDFTAATPAFASTLSSASFCGLSNWQAGTAQSLLGASCLQGATAANAQITEQYQIVGNQLLLTAAPLALSQSQDRNRTEDALDANHPFTRLPQGAQ